MKLKEELKRHESEKLKSTENLVKLHPVKPFTFNGYATEFPSFISNWNATVHNQGLTDGVKLRYLQDALGPKAKGCISMLKSGTEYE